MGFRTFFLERNARGLWRNFIMIPLPQHVRSVRTPNVARSPAGGHTLTESCRFNGCAVDDEIWLRPRMIRDVLSVTVVFGEVTTAVETVSRMYIYLENLP